MQSFTAAAAAAHIFTRHVPNPIDERNRWAHHDRPCRE
jgi:hypothetical protein